ncbi:MAG TPA: S8 family serine peptidase [Verrucomicrobiota bacterium]|nr:S8 family serine peptidase [Verrucomicrobiota bacterium]HPI64416.1 S8 family serine peptidase [Verrucomicrobiota bacterium]
MKAIKQIIGTVAVGCVLALSTTSNLQAQDQKSPPGTYYSAKDPDFVPLPFNRYPELPVVEVEPGIFVVDDTSIPDTLEQIVSRKLRQEAADYAKQLAANPALAQAVREAQEKATEAARQAQFASEFLPWLHHDIVAPDGTLPTLDDQLATQTANLQALSEAFAVQAKQNRQAVTEFLAGSGFDKFSKLEDGGVSAVVAVENGLPRAVATCNTLAADTVGTDELWPGGNTGFNLTGTNVAIGLWDGGDVRITHRELSTNGVRVTDIDGPSTLGTNDHPTHVSGTLAAYGVTNRARGMAHRGRILAADYIDDFVEMPTAVATNGFRVSNHSYGNQAGWGYASIGGTIYMVWWGDIVVNQNQSHLFGFYSGASQTIDQIANNAPTYLPVWAAANERGSAGAPIYSPAFGYYTFSNGVTIVSTASRPNDGDAGGYDTLTEQASAKNIFTVGAVNGITNGYAGSNSVVMSTFSSFGPTDDGRIKPDVVADGVNLYSTVATNDSSYATYSGTSMATPNTCGSLALLTELHTRLYGTNQPMLASTLKGLAIHTADEAGSAAGPDYRFGWGLLNARKAGLLVQSNYASASLAHIKEVRLTGGDYIEFPVVSAGAQPLIVTAQWNDPAGTPPAVSLDPTNRMLVNDLDLRIFAPNGTTNFPWVLNPANPTNAATTGDNIRDNVEQVLISTPATNGIYTIRLTHKGTNLVAGTAGATNEQWVSIFVSGNIAQAAPPLLITSIAMSSSNTVALKWDSVVGRVYQVQHRNDVATGAWSNSTGEISATKTNVAVNLSVPGGVDTRFYRVVQLR